MSRLGRTARNGWSWLLDYAYVSRHQVGGLLTRDDPAGWLAGDRQPVVLLPGVYERWQFLRPLARVLHDRGHPVHVVTDLRWNTAPVVASAAVVAAYLRDHDLRDVVLVAHSKGGLIGKYAMLHEDPEGRIARMVAVATPFGGSVYARLFWLRSVRAFSPRDPTLRALGEQLEVNRRITSIWGAFDPHVPGGSRLEGATNVPLRTSGHFRLLGRDELLDAVVEALTPRPTDPRAPVPPGAPRSRRS